MVVYNTDLSVSTFSHEAGHNLAKKTWGNTAPSRHNLTDYANAQKAEKPVSSYGSNSSAEDFAEACKMFVTSQGNLFGKFPKKFRALNKLLFPDAGERKAAAAAAKKLWQQKG